MANTDVKIADVLTGETLPIGQQGELCARGYFAMKGYDDDPEATATAIDQDDWLDTGDLAVMRPDGCLNITGRAKDMIIRGGENIYPREIENLQYTHPKVADAQVLGIPDEKLGEAIVAWIRLKTGECAGENEIREFCQGKIAHFKIPQHIRVCGAIPDDHKRQGPEVPHAASGNRDARYGLISMGVPSGTARQISSISASVTAIQPSVQSRRRCLLPIQPSPFGRP